MRGARPAVIYVTERAVFRLGRGRAGTDRDRARPDIERDVIAADGLPPAGLAAAAPHGGRAVRGGPMGLAAPPSGTCGAPGADRLPWRPRNDGLPTCLWPGDGGVPQDHLAGGHPRLSRISGDDDPVHVDPAIAARTAFGRMHRAWRACNGAALHHGEHHVAPVNRAWRPGTPVSAGYDRIRFTRPVFAGEVLTARYVIEDVDAARARTRAKLAIVNQDGETCLVGTHSLAWVSRPSM